jgi:pterin-4a-carbinolamine dehydratase
MTQDDRVSPGQDTIRSKLKAERIQATLAGRRAQSPLAAEALQERLRDTPGWRTSSDGSSLQRTYEVPSIRAAGLLAQLLLEVGEATGSIPDVDVRHLEVTVTVSTSTTRGVTDLDLDVARILDLRL